MYKHLEKQTSYNNQVYLNDLLDACIYATAVAHWLNTMSYCFNHSDWF